MISNSDDSVLRQDMPAALAKVEEAARLLVEASAISRTDPTSKVARTKLIEGSRYLGWTQAILHFLHVLHMQRKEISGARKSYGS